MIHSIVERFSSLIMLNKIAVLICLVSGAFAISTNVTVDGLGNVIGVKEATAWTNRPMYSFRGIPYAKPPIGNLRFRPPVKITSWNGTLFATKFGAACPQNRSPFSKMPSDNEDCLTLNVYVPQGDHHQTKLPVMIWLHGGAFVFGDASRYEPHYFLEKDIIVVVPQFRLGPLGLLCLQTDEIPGNVQFLDQIMAMKWVQDNIGYFGGDRNKVTLAGQSAGAIAVNLHQFSPLSKGLFHRAIIQSGSAFVPYSVDHNPVRSAVTFGASLGCNQTNVTELAACFKGLKVTTILDGAPNPLASFSDGIFRSIGGIRAVIQTAGTQRFLEEDPLTLLARSEYTQMPMIGGTTKNDGSLPLLMYYSSYLRPRGLVNDSDFLTYNLTSHLVSQFGITDESGGVSQTLTDVHFEESQMGDFSKMVPGIMDIASAIFFKAGVFRVMQANSRTNTSYLYTFGHFGKNRLLEAAGLPFDTGVGHGDEMYYLVPWTTLSGDDLIVAKRMISLWTSFVINGEPTADGEKWKPMSTAFGPYLNIKEELRHGSNFLSEYTIASREGLKPAHRSSAMNFAPQSTLVIVTMLFFIIRP